MVAPGDHIQRQRRAWSSDFIDQHGRRFEAQYEKANARPIGELSPHDFAVPWLPPMRYILWEREGSFRFRWDYRTMAADLLGDAQQYYQRVTEFMTEHMAGEDVPDIGDPVPSKVIRILGKPPLSPALPMAAEAGDPWLLGQAGAPVNAMVKAILEQSATSSGRDALIYVRERMAALVQHPVAERAPEVDDSVKPTRTIRDVDPAKLPDISYREYLAACLSRGLTMAEAALSWQEHKAALADDAAMVPA